MNGLNENRYLLRSVLRGIQELIAATRRHWASMALVNYAPIAPSQSARNIAALRDLDQAYVRYGVNRVASRRARHLRHVRCASDSDPIGARQRTVAMRRELTS